MTRKCTGIGHKFVPGACRGHRRHVLTEQPAGNLRRLLSVLLSKYNVAPEAFDGLTEEELSDAIVALEYNGITPHK